MKLIGGSGSERKELSESANGEHMILGPTRFEMLVLKSFEHSSRGLDNNSSRAISRPHIVEKVMSQCMRSPLEVLGTVQREPFNENIIIINDDEMLDASLGQCFPKPLLYLFTSKHASPITWANLWDYLQNLPRKARRDASLPRPSLRVRLSRRSGRTPPRGFG
ncbi:hypothetical protein BDW75DRAFT_225825 [Aspergillus navahoensis]